VDFLLLRDARLGRAVQNLGGIGNVTYLPPGRGAEEVLAFDTGPGNMVIDGVVRRLTDGGQLCDRDGAMAAEGQIDHELVSDLLEAPFYADPPPKSTGREQFGARFVGEFLKEGHRRGLGPNDLVATATALTVESLALAYERFLWPAGPVDEIILSGGGTLNATLVLWIHECFTDCRVVRSDEFGLPVSAKEAMCFAVLADESIEGRPNNLPSATGAKRPVVLGKIVLSD